MTIKNIITDKVTGLSAEIADEADEKHALVVATRPLKTYSNSHRPFANPDLGIDMNVAAVFTGTPLNIHDGTDKTQWTATAIVGGTHWDPDDPNVHAKDAVIEVVDYTAVGGEYISISLNEVVTTITEGADYTAETSNEVTATNIVTALASMVGASVSRDGAIVTLIADDAVDIDNISDDSSSLHMRVSARNIQATSTVNDDVLEIKTTGADVDLSNYAALTGYIWVSNWDTRGTDKGVEIELWLNNLQVVGTTTINLKNFINTSEFGSWQKFTVPFSEFNGTAAIIDSIRIKTIDIGSGQPPNYYLDLLQFQETGIVRDFTLAPKEGTWLHVHSIRYTFADEYDGGAAVDDTDNYWKPNGLPCIPYDGFLGINKLSSGIVFKTTQDDEIIQSASIKQLIDVLAVSGARIDNQGSDGTNTWFTVEHKLVEPFILKSEDADKMVFSISDDLSGLLHFRVSAGCKEEDRSLV